MKEYDVLIVGGGVVGAALACALAEYTSLSVVVLEQQVFTESWSDQSYHPRVSAINLASIQLLQALQVWESIKQTRISPFTKIQVWDAKGGDALYFDCRDIAMPALGCIVENNLLQQNLLDRMNAYPQVQYVPAVKLTSFIDTVSGVEVVTSEQQTFSAKIAIAADGANSWLRQQAGIAVNKMDYEEQALVATVRLPSKHNQVARQQFLTTGPLAFLPLSDPYLCSIVWTVPTMQGSQLMTVSDEAFCRHLSEVSQYDDIALVGKRFSFALSKQVVTQYVQSNVVLVGDAAHKVHPLAGQGLNIGLQDVSILVAIIRAAMQQGRRWSSAATLRRYERKRKADNLPMLFGIDFIKKLYTDNQATLTSWRHFGISLTQQSTWLRNIFTRHAVGHGAACESFG